MYRTPTRAGAIAGVLASLVLTGLLALMSELTNLSFLPLDLADLLIRLTPGKIATFGIEALGPLAKMAIEAGSIVGFVVIGGILGALFGLWTSRGRPRPALVAGELFGSIMALFLIGLQLSDPTTSTLTTSGGLLLIGLALGWGIGLGYLFDHLRPIVIEAPAATGATGATMAGTPLDPTRRVFLQRSAAAAVTLAVGSTALAETLRRASEVAAVALPAGAFTAATTATNPTAGAMATGATVAALPPAATPPLASFKVPPGVRPYITPIDKLYTVASRTRDPVVDPNTYRLVIDGRVKRPLSLSLADLMARPRIDQTSTLQCVSNEVGGNLIGNVNWNGTPLKALLETAGLEPEATRLVFHAAEGYVDSLPLEVALLPTTLVVYGADGQPLPRKHGFPVRVIVPTIYGMKNVKWLQRIEVIKGDFKGYWQERGWSNDATVKTTAVTDTRNNLRLENGIIPIGGIAFAGDRGISSVEVMIDDQPWAKAALAPEVKPYQWRAWRYDWQATPGAHRITVRAVDGKGQPQSMQPTAPHPDGAAGYHMVKVDIAA